MKKFVALLLAVIMALALVACGEKPAEPQGGEDAGPKDYSTWPEKDIVLNVNSKPGSSGDTLARQLALACEEANLLNGHKMIINNIIDGTGYETWKPVSEDTSDGYLLAILSTSLPSCDALGTSALSADKDLTYISGFFTDPQWVYCAADKPYNTVGELLDYIKAHPGEVNWGSASAVGMDALAAAQLFSSDDTLTVNRVSFDGGAEQLTAMLGGFVDVGITEYLDIDAQVQAGNLKIIGVLSAEREPSNPDVQTALEGGWDVVLDRARGVAGPKDMDPALVARISEVMKQAWAVESFQTWMTQNCVSIRFMEGPEFLDSYMNVYDFTVENMDKLNG